MRLPPGAGNDGGVFCLYVSLARTRRETATPRQLRVCPRLWDVLRLAVTGRWRKTFPHSIVSPYLNRIFTMQLKTNKRTAQIFNEENAFKSEDEPPARIELRTTPYRLRTSSYIRRTGPYQHRTPLYRHRTVPYRLYFSSEEKSQFTCNGSEWSYG